MYDTRKRRIANNTPADVIESGVLGEMAMTIPARDDHPRKARQEHAVHPGNLAFDRNEAFFKQRVVEFRSLPEADKAVEVICKPGEHCAASILWRHTAYFTFGPI